MELLPLLQILPHLSSDICSRFLLCYISACFLEQVKYELSKCTSKYEIFENGTQLMTPIPSQLFICYGVLDILKKHILEYKVILSHLSS